MLSTGELVSLQRSAAMVGAGQTYPLPRDVVIELVAEVIESRQLLERLGGDLRAVAARSRRPS